MAEKAVFILLKPTMQSFPADSWCHGGDAVDNSNFLGKVVGIQADEINSFTLTFTSSISKNWRAMWMRPKWLFTVLNKKGIAIHIQFTPSHKGAQRGLAWTEVVPFEKSIAKKLRGTFESDFKADSKLVAYNVPPNKNPADFPVHYFELLHKRVASPPSIEPPVSGSIETNISQPESHAQKPVSERGALIAKKNKTQKNASPKISKGGMKKRLTVPGAAPIKQPKTWRSPHITCVLCGKKLMRGTLLEHKELIHGEKAYQPASTKSRYSRPWVSIVQGGLPGLGRRR